MPCVACEYVSLLKCVSRVIESVSDENTQKEYEDTEYDDTSCLSDLVDVMLKCN